MNNVAVDSRGVMSDHDCGMPILLKGLLMDKGFDDSLVPTIGDLQRWMEELDRYEASLVSQMKIASDAFNKTFYGNVVLTMRHEKGKERNRWNDNRVSHRLAWTIWGMGRSKTDSKLFQNEEGQTYLKHFPDHMLQAISAYERVRMRLNAAAEIIRVQRTALRRYLDDMGQLEAFMKEQRIPAVSVKNVSKGVL